MKGVKDMRGLVYPKNVFMTSMCFMVNALDVNPERAA